MKNIFIVIFISALLYSCSSTETNKYPKRFPSKYEKAMEYYVACEIMPEPVGGIGNIQNKVVMPDIVKRDNIDGLVYVNAYINEEGTVDFVEVVKGINPECDTEALRVVKAAKFKPGTQKGKSIKMVVTVPIIFK